MNCINDQIDHIGDYEMNLSTSRSPSRSFARTAAAALLLASGTIAHAQSPAGMRVAGNFSTNVRHSEGIERPFFTGLPAATGIPLAVNFNPMDVVNVKADDALRLLRSGTFDVMAVQMGSVARDDPFVEGIDLVGVSTDMQALRAAVDAYRSELDARMQRRFKTKILTLWPFGPQVFYCSKPIASVDDFRGLKVRSFTPTMSALLQKLGATPVTIPFAEVYPALANGVVDCGVTSPNSGNSGKWPEVTGYYFPLSVSGSVQGHFANLDYWNRFSPEQQAKIQAEFRKMEDQMWQFAIETTADSQRCNTGGECKTGTPFKMKLVEPSDTDRAKIAAAVMESVLPIWRDACNKVDPACSSLWNKTVGAARGLTIQ